VPDWRDVLVAARLAGRGLARAVRPLGLGALDPAELVESYSAKHLAHAGALSRL